MDTELREDQMIQDNYQKNPLPAWLYLALVAILAVLLWGGGSWYYERQRILHEINPFIQVTNRQFSLFLWQFPEYMRANVSAKTGYLPDFQYSGKVSIEPGRAENYVSAPPHVLFLYHTWSRLLAEKFPTRPIPTGEFRDFLENCPEWKPENWPDAPQAYLALVESIDIKENMDLSHKGLPKQVEQAFIGWKNFFVEGVAINDLHPTYKEMDDFLTSFPHYARNYWRNIVMQGKPDYLKMANHSSPSGMIPENEISAFLKVAFFNYIQANKNL